MSKRNGLIFLGLQRLLELGWVHSSTKFGLQLFNLRSVYLEAIKDVQDESRLVRLDQCSPIGEAITKVSAMEHEDIFSGFDEIGSNLCRYQY